MGQTDTRPVIIEFNGIPGAGKTTTTLEVKKLLRTMEIRDVPSKKIIQCHKDYKEIILSKKIRDVYIIFLKALLLVTPITWERLSLMNMTFNYWLGMEKMYIKGNQKKGICVLDQGIVQGFISMAYQGKIRNEKKYCRYIRQVMNQLDNVICINCNVDADISMMRMRTRKSNGGRLQQINDDKKLREALVLQKHQFERIRKRAIKNFVAINMNAMPEYNAEKIVRHCMKYL